jgi:hypothetical protein
MTDGDRDPIWLADIVMACLELFGTKALKMDVHYQGEVFAFALARETIGDRDQVGVSLNGRTMLLVDLFLLDQSALKENAPLAKQVLHTVKFFDDSGAWVPVLRGAIWLKLGRPDW